MGQRSLKLAAFLGILCLFVAAVLLTIAWREAFPRFVTPGSGFLAIGLLLLGHVGLQLWCGRDAETKSRLRVRWAVFLFCVVLFLWLLQSLFIITVAAMDLPLETMMIGIGIFIGLVKAFSWLSQKLLDV